LETGAAKKFALKKGKKSTAKLRRGTERGVVNRKMGRSKKMKRRGAAAIKKRSDEGRKVGV